MLKKYYPFIIFLCLSIVFDFIFFYGLRGDQYIYIGDQFLRFNLHETIVNAFYIHKLDNLGVLNGWQFVVQFWDVLYYLVVYLLHIPLQISERVLFALVLFISFILSFKGFQKLSTLFFKTPVWIYIVLTTIWYVINPYTVILWHGGIYNLGLSLTYSLTPLILYYFIVTIFNKPKIKNILILALLLFLSSFVFWLFAVVVFFLICFFIFYFCFNPGKIKNVLASTILILVVYLPLVSFILFNILYEYFNNSGNNNTLFMPTFGNEMGGIRYQLYFIYSWGIYNVWVPRAMFSFHKFYFSNYYKDSVKLFYLVLGFGISIVFVLKSIPQLRSGRKFIKIIRKKYGAYVHYLKYIFNPNYKLNEFKILPIILFIFAISTFLAKGIQPPYGQIFSFLYYKVPFFSVFRTADIRFGFSMIFCLSIIFLIVSSLFRKYIIFPLLIVIVVVLNYPFISGIALRGENIGNRYYERVQEINQNEKSIARIINSDNSSGEYVLPIPSTAYGHYDYLGNKHHFGQDILSKMINKPFMYLSSSDGTFTKTYSKLTALLNSKNLEFLKNFPVKYIIYRNDVVCDDCIPVTEMQLAKNYSIVAKNSSYTLFKINQFTPIIYGSGVSFKMISPDEYKVHINNVAKVNLLPFLQSYNRDWKLYVNTYQQFNCPKGNLDFYTLANECRAQVPIFRIQDIGFLFTKPLTENHSLLFGYANAWKINPKMIENYGAAYYFKNSDGSISADFTIFYLPEANNLLFLLISVLTFITILVFLLYFKYFKKIKYYVKHTKIK